MAQGRLILVADGPERTALQAALAGRPVACRSAADAPSAEGTLFVLVCGQGGDIAELAATGKPVVAVLPVGAGLTEVLAAQRAGAAQVALLPLVPADLLAAIDRAAQQAASVGPGLLVAVVGVTGGAGATTLALALAQEIGARAAPGRACLLAELPRQMGTLAACLGIEPACTTHALLADPARLTASSVRQALTRVSAGLDVLAGPYQEFSTAVPPARSVARLIEASRALASVVVLDLPCSLDSSLFEALALADHVLLVGVQTVASVRALRLVRDLLVREEGLQSAQPVVNRFDSSLPGFDAARLAGLLGTPDLRRVADDYPALMAAMGRGRPLREAVPTSPVAADVRRLAEAVLGEPPSPARPPAERLPGRSIRVLHIEDDPIQREVLLMHLGRLRGMRCTVATAGNEADGVELFRREPPDLVVLDYHLDEGNGLSVLRRLRAMDALVPIVVVSSLNEPQVAAGLLEAGADDFLSKGNLGGGRLPYALETALGRSGAMRTRSGRAGASLDDEMRALLAELHAAIPPGRFGVAEIQRLGDQACADLERLAPGQLLPRRAVLGLFLRLFGRQQSDTIAGTPSPRDSSP